MDDIQQTQRMKKWMRAIIAIGIVILLMVGFNQIIGYEKNLLVPPVSVAGPPVLLHMNDETPSDTFHPGEAFLLRTKTQRIAACDVTILYSILETRAGPDGTIFRRYWFHFRPLLSHSGPGTFITDERQVIPRFIPPGDYLFNRTAKYLCNRIEIDNKSTPLPLHLVGPVIHETEDDR